MAEEEKPADDKTPSHARGPTAEAKALKRARIVEIMGMMARFEWARGESAEILAERWGLSTSTVEDYSAEAHRRSVADKDEAEREISSGARKLFRQAVTDGDAKAAKMMGDLWADVAGAKAPQRKEVDARVAAVGLEELDELRKAVSANACPTEPDETSDESEPNS